MKGVWHCFYGSFKGIIDTGGDNNYSHHTVNRLKHSKSVRRRGQHNLDVDTGMNLSGIASIAVCDAKSKFCDAKLNVIRRKLRCKAILTAQK